MRKVQSAPKPLVMVDYEGLAKDYNALEYKEGGDPFVGINRVYNITLFKRALTARGLIEGTDFVATTRGDHTYVIKKSPKAMQG